MEVIVAGKIMAKSSGNESCSWKNDGTKCTVFITMFEKAAGLLAEDI